MTRKRLEHEGQSVVDLMRLELVGDRALEGRRVGAVAGHAVVQRGAARQEPFGLGIVDAAHQPHELAHAVAVEPGRPEAYAPPPANAAERSTKSQLALPAVLVGEVSTVKIEGSGWSKLTVPMALKRARSYL